MVDSTQALDSLEVAVAQVLTERLELLHLEVVDGRGDLLRDVHTRQHERPALLRRQHRVDDVTQRCERVAHGFNRFVATAQRRERDVATQRFAESGQRLRLARRHDRVELHR